MASKFQSRLVGTIILVSIGVIVLPDVLDGKKLHYKEEFATIPIKPELESDLESFEILEPIRESISLPESPVQEIVATNSNGTNVEIDDFSTRDIMESVSVGINQVTQKNEYQDSAWIIQLMALRNHENAERLVADLQNRGYQAHTKKENGLTRVIVGPDVSKNKLEQQVGELQQITGSKGQLLNFNPLNP